MGNIVDGATDEGIDLNDAEECIILGNRVVNSLRGINEAGTCDDNTFEANATMGNTNANILSGTNRTFGDANNP